ncbi:MAG: Sodium/hydrogen exchanger family protein [Candidatus Izimaplasma bacterium HR2]|nr:MAG: Sodium/hydrogen exchanger family protein [Candidatus Izimaplasma bacterium HR2]
METLLTLDNFAFVSFYEVLTESIIYNIALLLTLGIIGGKLANLVKLPKVTGYIIIGIIAGPSALHLLSSEVLYSFKPFKILALGFIGFNIGMELNFSNLKSSGRHVLFITFSQAILTFLMVMFAVVLFVDEYKWTYGLIFGAIATVTTPAPILACIKSYNVKGRLSDLLCPMVALDDAIGIMIFAFVLPISVYLAGHSGEVISGTTLIIGPLFEIGFSILIGSIIGLILIYVLDHFKKGDNVSLLLIVVIGILFGIAIGYAVEISAILLPLTIGVLIANGLEREFMFKIKENTDAIILPLLLIFFTLSGAELKIHLLWQIGGLGLIYIVVRLIAKYLATSFSSKIIGENGDVVKYLGVALIPQGGVAIDMAILAEFRFIQLANETNSALAEIGSTILTVILAATVIYKIFGEIIVKWAFDQAHEIPKHDQDYLEHQHVL